jgi:GAF domain-containing protein
MTRTDLAGALAAAALTIHHEHSLEDTLDAIARSARVSVPGFDHAGISTMDKRGNIVTRAATDDLVRFLDELQYNLEQGPCVDAMRDERIVVVSDIQHDPRWPAYVAEGARVTGLRSQLAVRIFLDDEGTLGGLNLYSTSQSHVDEDASSAAELFAAHAAVALGHAYEVNNLATAMSTRKIIGQALGIVMERHHIDERRAFAYLGRISSTTNVKLRDIATELVGQVERSATPASNERLRSRDRA